MGILNDMNKGTFTCLQFMIVDSLVFVCVKEVEGLHNLLLLFLTQLPSLSAPPLVTRRLSGSF